MDATKRAIVMLISCCPFVSLRYPSMADRVHSLARIVDALEDIVGERSGASDTKSLEHGKDFLVSILKRVKQS